LKIVELKAQKVNPPKLLFDATNKEITATIDNGAWNLAKQSSFIQKGTKCTKLNVMYLATKIDKLDEVRTILKELARYSIADGDIDIKSSATGSLPQLPDSASREATRDFKKKYRADCQSIFDRALSSLKESPDDIPPFILMVLPSRDIALYSEIKRWGDCVVGIPTVCITSAKLLKVGDATLRANIWYVYHLKSWGYR
jgi:hypothetical protein